MALIIAATLAIIATIVRLSAPEFGVKYKLGFLALITWAASLMWCVDGFAALIEGESFIELTDAEAVLDDALLGATVVGFALAVWLLSLVISSVKAKATQGKQSRA